MMNQRRISGFLEKLFRSKRTERVRNRKVPSFETLEDRTLPTNNSPSQILADQARAAVDDHSQESAVFQMTLPAESGQLVAGEMVRDPATDSVAWGVSNLYVDLHSMSYPTTIRLALPDNLGFFAVESFSVTIPSIYGKKLAATTSATFQVNAVGGGFVEPVATFTPTTVHSGWNIVTGGPLGTKSVDFVPTGTPITFHAAALLLEIPPGGVLDGTELSILARRVEPQSLIVHARQLLASQPDIADIWEGAQSEVEMTEMTATLIKDYDEWPESSWTKAVSKMNQQLCEPLSLGRFYQMICNAAEGSSSAAEILGQGIVQLSGVAQLLDIQAAENERSQLRKDLVVQALAASRSGKPPTQSFLGYISSLLQPAKSELPPSLDLSPDLNPPVQITVGMHQDGMPISNATSAEPTTPTNEQRHAETLKDETLPSSPASPDVRPAIIAAHFWALQVGLTPSVTGAYSGFITIGGLPVFVKELRLSEIPGGIAMVGDASTTIAGVPISIRLKEDGLVFHDNGRRTFNLSIDHKFTDKFSVKYSLKDEGNGSPQESFEVELFDQKVHLKRSGDSGGFGFEVNDEKQGVLIRQLGLKIIGAILSFGDDEKLGKNGQLELIAVPIVNSKEHPVKATFVPKIGANGFALETKITVKDGRDGFLEGNVFVDTNLDQVTGELHGHLLHVAHLKASASFSLGGISLNGYGSGTLHGIEVISGFVKGNLDFADADKTYLALGGDLAGVGVGGLFITPKGSAILKPEDIERLKTSAVETAEPVAITNQVQAELLGSVISAYVTARIIHAANPEMGYFQQFAIEQGIKLVVDPLVREGLTKIIEQLPTQFVSNLASIAPYANVIVSLSRGNYIDAGLDFISLTFPPAAPFIFAGRFIVGILNGRQIAKKQESFTTAARKWENAFQTIVVHLPQLDPADPATDELYSRYRNLSHNDLNAFEREFTFLKNWTGTLLGTQYVEGRPVALWAGDVARLSGPWDPESRVHEYFRRDMVLAAYSVVLDRYGVSFEEAAVMVGHPGVDAYGYGDAPVNFLNDLREVLEAHRLWKSWRRIPD